jgi:hypothetical protein
VDDEPVPERANPLKESITSGYKSLLTQYRDEVLVTQFPNDKSRVAFYYLLAEKFGKLAAFH